MASTFSPTLRLELIGEGDQSGIWGQTTNQNLGALLEQAITGVQNITMLDANYTMTSFNGVPDEARNAILVVGGTLTQQRNLIAPLVEKVYTIKNSTTGGFGVQIVGATGTGVVIPNGQTMSVYCDGTDFYTTLTGTAGNFRIAGNLNVVGTTSLSSALTYGGVTLSNAVTGTGSMVLSTSPALTGVPTAPTAAGGTNTTQIATTAFVTTVVNTLGTMATQNANAVAITGGTITGSYGLTAANATNAVTVTGATQNSITSIPNLATVGTISSGTWNATLGAVSGANLTSLNASNLGSGTVPSARLSGTYNIAISGNAATATSATNATNATNATTASNANAFQGKTKLGLGLTGETWQDVTGARAQGVTYYAPNYPIQVQGNFGCNGGGQGQIYINGVLVSFWQAQFNGCGGYSVNMPCIVPPNASYVLASMGGGARGWYELR